MARRANHRGRVTPKSGRTGSGQSKHCAEDEPPPPVAGRRPSSPAFLLLLGVMWIVCGIVALSGMSATWKLIPTRSCFSGIGRCSFAAGRSPLSSETGNATTRTIGPGMPGPIATTSVVRLSQPAPLAPATTSRFGASVRINFSPRRRDLIENHSTPSRIQAATASQCLGRVILRRAASLEGEIDHADQFGHVHQRTQSWGRIVLQYVPIVTTSERDDGNKTRQSVHQERAGVGRQRHLRDVVDLVRR